MHSDSLVRFHHGIFESMARKKKWWEVLIVVVVLVLIGVCWAVFRDLRPNGSIKLEYQDF